VLLGAELRAVAEELSAVGLWEQAADAYVLLGDGEAEVRVLEEAGAIERLEQRLAAQAAAEARGRERAALMGALADLDRTGERRAACERAERWLERGPDEAVEVELTRIRAKLLRGPLALLELEGHALRVAFGTEATIGRTDATIVVGSSAVSRQHVRLFRRQGEVWLEDLGTRNGTCIRGARLSAPVPVGAGLELELAGQIPCAVGPGKPSAAAPGLTPVLVRVAGQSTLLPLGPLPAGSSGGWSIDFEPAGGSGLVVLRTNPGSAPPIMAGLTVADAVELAAGDELSETRGGPVVLRVLGRDSAPGGGGP
jgi:hypothetical protein